jgi:hypothetical protein
MRPAMQPTWTSGGLAGRLLGNGGGRLKEFISAQKHKACLREVDFAHY